MINSPPIVGLVLAVMMLHTQPATADFDRNRVHQVAFPGQALMPCG
jgi:hypothetical protein